MPLPASQDHIKLIVCTDWKNDFKEGARHLTKSCIKTAPMQPTDHVELLSSRASCWTSICWDLSPAGRA